MAQDELLGLLGRRREGDGVKANDRRLNVRKTYKMFVGGAFVRSESGRSYPVHSPDGELLARASAGSRKDVRDAVRSARGAQPGWAARSAYNRGQILYRVAEVMDSRRSEVAEEVARAVGGHAAVSEVDAAVDRWVWYAGWCDKFPQVLGGANPVAGDYFNFTVPEPVGVVGIAAPENSPLLGLVSRLAPALVSGNAAVVLSSECFPLPSVTLAEILATGDVPPGVVNVLTGRRPAMLAALAGHGEVDCLDLTGCEQTPQSGDGPEPLVEAESLAAKSVTRVVKATTAQRLWFEPSSESPYLIGEFCEYKTVWHPKGR